MWPTNDQQQPTTHNVDTRDPTGSKNVTSLYFYQLQKRSLTLTGVEWRCIIWLHSITTASQSSHLLTRRQLPLVRSFHAYFCVSSYLAINLCLYKSVPIDIGFIWKGQNIVLFSSILRGGFIALLREEWARIRSRAIIFGFSPRLDMVQTCPHENNLLWNFPPASNLAENRPQTQRRQITNHAK